MSLICRCSHSRGVLIERGSTVYDIEGEEERERKSVFKKVPNDECVGVIADSCKMYINL